MMTKDEIQALGGKFPPELGGQIAEQLGWDPEAAKEDTWARRKVVPIQIQPPPGEGPGEPGQPKKPGKKGKPGEPGKPGKPGDEKKPGEPGDKPDTGDTPAPSPEDIHRDIEEKLAKKRDSAAEKQNDPEGKQTQRKKAEPNPVTSTPTAEWDVVTDKPKPKFGWKGIIDQFVRTSKEYETTYSKIHKRTITAMTAVSTTGSGAVKPGIRPVEEAYKLAAIFDSTGSMLEQMPRSLAEIEKLVNDHYGSIAGVIGVGMYGTDTPSYFALSLEKQKFWPIKTMKDLNKNPPAGILLPKNDLFSMRTGGGNELPDAGTTEILSLLSQGFNVIMMTDTDICSPWNWENLLKIQSTNKNHFFLILDDAESFARVTKQLGSIPSNWSHF